MLRTPIVLSTSGVRHARGLLTGGLLLAVALGCHGSHEEGAAGGGEEAAHPAGPVVVVAPAEERSIERTVSALARCETLPEKLAPLTAVIEGQVRDIRVQQGQAVTA